MTDNATNSKTVAAESAVQVDTQVRTKHSLPMGVLAICLNEARERLLAACLDGVYELNFATGESRRLYQHTSYVSGIALDPERPVVISAGYDGHLIWYDLQANHVFRHIRAHQFWSWQMAMAPDGQRIASVTGQYLAGSERYDPAPESEPSVKVYDVASGRLLQQFPHVPSVQAVAFSPDSRYVAAGNLMGQIRVWNVDTGERAADWTTDAFTSWGIIKSHCYIGGIYALAFAPDGESLLAAGMGPMRDPMAGNGRQLWQRFAWREPGAPRVDQTHEGESGEGLMETLAYCTSRDLFLMGGRLRGGDWNAALFSESDGRRLHHLNSGFRMTSAQFNSAGDTLYLAGCDKQKPPKDGKYPHFGVIEVRNLV